jgi:chloride channel 7
MAAAEHVPEFQSVLAFLNDHYDVDTWQQHIPFARDSVQRLQSWETAAIADCLAGAGTPALITDGFDGWPALSTWSFDFFKKQYGTCVVIANDRAPARHADSLPGGGGRQTSAALTVGQYIELHVDPLPPCLDRYRSAPPNSTPMYVNGWRAFVDAPALAADCPAPHFASGIDHTVQLLEAVDARLFGPQPAGEGSKWCAQVDANLTKVFMGPPGTVTRLHFDAGEAHGWLGQCVGRKLFVLLPPSDGPLLCPLASEKETEQSPIDPLRPDLRRWSSYGGRASPLCCVVHPGQALLVPRGWWHYAVALDRSITVQRNFYNATSNAGGLVRLVLKTADALRAQRK